MIGVVIMTNLVIRQHVSLYNQQAISDIISKFVDTSFTIKRKGKHCFRIYFSEHVDDNIVNILCKKMGLCIVYESAVRYILTDDIALY